MDRAEFLAALEVVNATTNDQLRAYISEALAAWNDRRDGAGDLATLIEVCRERQMCISIWNEDDGSMEVSFR